MLARVGRTFFKEYMLAMVLCSTPWVLDSRPRGRGFEPHRRHCVVSLSKNINPRLVLVQPRKTRPFITERLLMGRKESNQTNKATPWSKSSSDTFDVDDGALVVAARPVPYSPPQFSER